MAAAGHVAIPEQITNIGSSYVGPPTAPGIVQAFGGLAALGINAERVAQVREGIDITHEFEPGEFAGLDVTYTDDPAALRHCTSVYFHMPAIDGNRQLELGPLRLVCPTIGKMLNPSAVVVSEATVYSGATEEVSGPILPELSGLRQGIYFKLGYSPKRINPGDRVHGLGTIVKAINDEPDARKALMTESETWAETNGQSVEVTFVAQWGLSVTRPNLCELLILAEFSR